MKECSVVVYVTVNINKYYIYICIHIYVQYNGYTVLSQLVAQLRQFIPANDCGTRK